MRSGGNFFNRAPMPDYGWRKGKKMSREALERMYPEGRVYDSRYELGFSMKQILTRKGNEKFLEKFPPSMFTSCSDRVYYDIAEMALSSHVAFYSDGFIVWEDTSELPDEFM